MKAAKADRFVLNCFRTASSVMVSYEWDRSLYV